MTKNHLKSLSAPKTWKIKRKKETFVTRPYPTGQKMDFVLPLNIIFKDFLKYCKTSKEVRMILNEKEVTIDGIRIKEPHVALGLLSVMSINDVDEHYRLTINTNGKLELRKIDKKETEIKPCRIVNKKIIGKDKVQINMSDGRNILLKKNDYKTGDTLIITIPKQEVKEHIPLEKGTIIMLTGGKHVGRCGTVEKIEDKQIFFTDDESKVHQTEKRYALAIGIKKPSITV